MTDIDDVESKWKLWGVILFLSIFWHLILLWIRPSWQGHAPAVPPRIDVQRVDPKKLEAIRRQWKAKELLLNKDRARQNDPAPPDAKYLSDRNIRVEKEQRARQTDILPQPHQQESKASENKTKSLSLGDLGVPIPLPQKKTQRARRGGDQSILDRKLPEGSENLLNAQESVYYSFYARLYEAIAPIWQSRVREVPYRRRLMPGDYTTTVDVVLDQQGNLLEIRQETSSGISEFDEAVHLSWRKIGRFPNPPQGLLDKQGRVHVGWVFTVQVGKSAQLQYLPPERTY